MPEEDFSRDPPGVYSKIVSRASSGNCAKAHTGNSSGVSGSGYLRVHFRFKLDTPWISS